MGTCCGTVKPKIISTLVNNIFLEKKEIKGNDYIDDKMDVDKLKQHAISKMTSLLDYMTILKHDIILVFQEF